MSEAGILLAIEEAGACISSKGEGAVLRTGMVAHAVTCADAKMASAELQRGAASVAIFDAGNPVDAMVIGVY